MSKKLPLCSVVQCRSHREVRLCVLISELSLSIVAQVGNLSTAARYWGYPEADKAPRPSFYIPTSIGTADLTASMSAAFAAASLALRPVYASYAQVQSDPKFQLPPMHRSHQLRYMTSILLECSKRL